MKLIYQLPSSLPRLRAACPLKDRQRRACAKELQSWREQVIRQQAQSGWGSYDLVWSAPPSAPPVSSSLPLIVRPWTSAGAFTPIPAILEGVAFSLRDTLTIFAEMNVPVATIRLGGGGARAPLWLQIQADVYGLAVEILAAEEGAAYGAALLAGVGSGVWSSVDEACAQAVRVASRVEPDQTASALMNSRYAAFRALYPALRGVDENLSDKL